MKTFTAYIVWDPVNRFYVGMVPGIPGAHTQGDKLDDLKENLEDVLKLCLEEHKIAAEYLPHFAGLQQIEVAI